MLCVPSQDVSFREVASEDLETVVATASCAPSKVTLHDLLDTLKLLEEEPELLPQPKACKKDIHAWIDGVGAEGLPSNCSVHATGMG